MRLGRLFWKFFFAFWLALLLAGATVGSAVWWHQQGERSRIEAERDSALAGGPRAAMAVSAAAAVLGHGGVAALRAWLADWPRERLPLLYVVDGAGRELLGREVSAAVVADARQRARSAEPRRPAREVATADGQAYLLFIPADAVGRDGRGFGPRHPPEPPGLWVPVTAGLVASVVFSALLAWYLSKPIRHLRWAFGAVAEGKLETRVRPLMGARRDEIADLGGDFDRMAQQLQKLIGAQRRLLHDVSHELRSPLARLQAAIGLMRQDPSRLEASIERIERETGRVDELVGQLLTLARLEAGSRDLHEEPVDLMELAVAIADDAGFEAESLGRRLHFDGQGEARALVRVEQIQRAFDNVIRNALKFTPDGGDVEVQATTGEGGFRLRVDDRGPGVAAADLEAIFEPFHRGGNGHASGGFGLGLAIARRAVEAHGGHIRAINRAGGGLRVEIFLPLPPVAVRKGWPAGPASC